MPPTDTPHTPDGSILTPGNYPLYEYPAYTFDRKYENDEFQKKVITIDSGYHLVLAPLGCGKTDFYVAMTRAKKHLHITYVKSVSGISKWGNHDSIDTEPT